MDVLEGYKERKAQIGKAALENCAEEQMDWNLCMKSGEWTSRMTMCRKEVQRFERCYMTQAVCVFFLFFFSLFSFFLSVPLYSADSAILLVRNCVLMADHDHDKKKAIAQSPRIPL